MLASLLHDPERDAAEHYFMETGLDFCDLTPTEQKRRIEERING